MNLKQELKKRNIQQKEFAEAIDYTQQGLHKAIGTLEKPKAASKVMRLAFFAFLAERAGVKLEKLV